MMVDNSDSDEFDEALLALRLLDVLNGTVVVALPLDGLMTLPRGAMHPTTTMTSKMCCCCDVLLLL
jgi:hypothetical protein